MLYDVVSEIKQLITKKSSVMGEYATQTTPTRSHPSTIKSCVCSLSGRIQVLPQGMTCIITDISDITVHVLTSFINLYIEFVFLAC